MKVLYIGPGPRAGAGVTICNTFERRHTPVEVEIKSLRQLIEEYGLPPEAKVRGGRIICDFCDRPAESVHLLTSDFRNWEVKAACSRHDPGGYWFYLADFAKKPLVWLTHMAEKTDLRVVAFLQWLGCRGAGVLERMIQDAGCTSP